MSAGGPFEPRISIITLGVTDMARSIAFYRDGLGFPTNITGPTAEWAIFRTVGTRFAKAPQIAEAMAEALDREFKSVAFSEVYPSPERLAAALKKRADKIIQKYEREHFLYDHRTRHGRTQGAHFP